MLPAPPSTPDTPHPALLAFFAKAYAQGRRDFVNVAIDALSQPGFSEVLLTPTQVANMLRQASEKCDSIQPPKPLTN